MIISIGKHFYVALAKGPINESHVLILPIQHILKTSILTTEEFEELKLFKQSLIVCFAERNEVVCFFERNYRSPHLQVNAVAIDADLGWKIKNTIEVNF